MKMSAIKSIAHFPESLQCPEDTFPFGTLCICIFSIMRTFQGSSECLFDGGPSDVSFHYEFY